MRRSLLCCVALAQGKLHAWHRLLIRVPAHRILLGLHPEDKPPSTSAHDRFIRFLTGNTHTSRSLPRSFIAERAATHIEPTPYDSLQDKLAHHLLHKQPLEHPIEQPSPTLDLLVRLGLEPLAHAGVFDHTLDLLLDGTIHASHASPKGRSLTSQEIETLRERLKAQHPPQDPRQQRADRRVRLPMLC